MRGLIYKDVCMFFKTIDKKIILLAGAAIVLLMVKGGPYAGLLTTIMLSMTIGIQNVMSFASDEKTNWKKYELTMPVRSWRVVASKYISVVMILSVSVVLSLLLYFISGIIHENFDRSLLLISVASSLILPMIWTSVCLPLSYWFGFRSAQTMGLLVVIPVFYMVKYFEDGQGLGTLPASVQPYLFAGFIIAAAVFGLSYGISILGYRKKK